jgi:type I restriction enzyme S subunit
MTEALERAREARPRRFRPYPEYKDSGVEWLGEIPKHREVERLKDYVLQFESGETPESGNLDYWTDGGDGIPWVAISDMTRDSHVRETAKRVTEQGRHSKGLRILAAGTLPYSMYASLGMVALLETDAVINRAILGVVPHPSKLLREYPRRWFEFMQAHVRILSSGNTQDNLNADKVRKTPAFLPVALNEQPAIAAFLDRETAKIDALAAKVREAIDRLKEFRTALIFVAVTGKIDVKEAAG